MIKKIKVEQLRPGIFIHNLNREWLYHPFLYNRIKVTDEHVIDKIIEYGIKEVYIDTDKGLDIYHAPLTEDMDKEIQSEIENPAKTKVGDGPRVPLKEEIVRANKIIRETKKTMSILMEEVRLGKQIEIKQVEHIVEKMADSIFNNKDALVSLSRIRKKDEYTYIHSLAVCALLISFAEHLNLDYTTVKAVGVGGLLHDIGKVKVPNEILNKRGALSEQEFDEMRDHVKHGSIIIEQDLNVDETALSVVAHHHERFNGTGYPSGLKGHEISKFGQMAAIVDVYDALTSDRCYSNKIPPTEALKKLFEWRNTYFNKDLVEQFICCVGIYPIGTLVRLESDWLGVVIEHGEKGLLYPVIRVIYDIKKEKYVIPYDVDLSKLSGEENTEVVLNAEPPDRWNIKPEMYL